LATTYADGKRNEVERKIDSFPIAERKTLPDDQRKNGEGNTIDDVTDCTYVSLYHSDDPKVHRKIP